MKFKKSLSLFYLFIFLLLAAFIVYQSLEDSASSSRWSGETENFLDKIPIFKKLGGKIPDFSSYVRKFIGHFCLFAACGFFGFLALPSLFRSEKAGIAANYLSGIFLAVFSEFLQSFIKGRSSELRDSVIDFEGYITAVFFLLTILILKRIRKGKKIKIGCAEHFIGFFVCAAVAAFYYILRDANAQRIFCNRFSVCFNGILTVIFAAVVFIFVKRRKKTDVKSADFI